MSRRLNSMSCIEYFLKLFACYVYVYKHTAGFYISGADPVDLVATIESVLKLSQEPDETQHLIRQQITSLVVTHELRSIIPRAQQDALRTLKADKSIMILPADKRQSTVILDKAEYLRKANALLEDSEGRFFGLRDKGLVVCLTAFFLFTMSDESSDEYFASADEGSVSETDEILQSNATQAVLKTPVPENVTATRQFEATCNTRSAVEECPGPVFSSPVDEPTRDLATYAVASSVKMQSGLPQKLAKEVLVEPKHTESESCAEPGPPSDLAFGDTESIVDRGLINFVETLQPTPSFLEFHTSENPMIEDPIGYVKDDKVTPRESNRGDNETEKGEELIKNLSAPVNIVDGSPLSCTLMPIPDGSVPAVTADGCTPELLDHTTNEFLAADCSPIQLVTPMSKPEELNSSFCQQKCMPSPSETPPKVTSESLNQHSYGSDWYGPHGLDRPEPQKSYSVVGDERTRMTSATFLESEGVNAWDEGDWDDSEKVADSRDSSDEPGSHPNVVTDSGLSSVVGAPALSCNMKPLVGGTDQETPARILDGTLGQQASSTVEIETVVPSCSSSDKYYATEVLSAPCAVDAEEHNRPMHPTDYPGLTLSPNSKCETEYSEPSTQQRKITAADKHDLPTESGSTIESVHKTSTASQASDEAEGWDLSCVSVLPSLPAASKSSLSGQEKSESSCSVAFKRISNDWDADWINEEEEEEVAKATPDRSTTDQKKDRLLEHCEDGTRPEESSDDWDFDEWDCADKTPAVVAMKTTPKPTAHSQIAQKTTDSSNVPVLPEYLSTAATSLVKTVGGGLASFVDSFSLSNLSATLAAFDGAPQPAQQPQCADPIQDDAKPQDETEPMEDLSRSAVDVETKIAVNDEGWGLTGMSWSALAKSLSSTVENKGMQLLQGGVDVLETIGKKTFTALKETDPGLSYTKKFLLTPKSSQTTRLSQVLREASRQHQENLDEGPTRGIEGNAQHRRGDFAYQLEVRHALVHMEALELVSTRASAHLHAKITSLEDRELPRRTAMGKDMSISSLTNDGGILDKIWQTLQTAVSQTEEDESHLEGDCLVENVLANLDLLNSICPAATIQQKYKQLRERLKNPADTSSATDIFCVAIDSLAEATTAMLTYLHKLAECLLSRPEKVRDGFLDLAQKTTIIIQAGKKYNESLCSEYVKLLKQNESETPRQIVGPSVSDEVTPPISSKRHMANLFLETGAANDYLGSASGCFVPIVQLLCVNSFFPNTPS
ncbi:hypothetical protein SprV_0100192100 [Sparganum proliferum]